MGRDKPWDGDGNIDVARRDRSGTGDLGCVDAGYFSGDAETVLAEVSLTNLIKGTM